MLGLMSDKGPPPDLATPYGLQLFRDVFAWIAEADPDPAVGDRLARGLAVLAAQPEFQARYGALGAGFRDLVCLRAGGETLSPAQQAALAALGLVLMEDLGGASWGRR